MKNKQKIIKIFFIFLCGKLLVIKRICKNNIQNLKLFRFRKIIGANVEKHQGCYLKKRGLYNQNY